MAGNGQRGSASRLSERINLILSKLKTQSSDQVRKELIAEWDISRNTWGIYWKKVEKHLNRVTLREAKAFKGITFERLEELFNRCADVQEALKVLQAERELLGLDAPKQTQMQVSTGEDLSPVLGRIRQAETREEIVESNERL